jgi:hypothetical protein
MTSVHQHLPHNSTVRQYPYNVLFAPVIQKRLPYTTTADAKYDHSRTAMNRYTHGPTIACVLSYSRVS